MTEDKFHRLMQLAAQKELSQPIDDSYHYVDDVELMEAWAFGNISEAKRNEIIKHLAKCVYCRRETSAMVRHGVLNFSSTKTEEPEKIRVGMKRWDFYRGIKIFLAVAVVLMVAFVGIWIINPTQQQIARVPLEPSTKGGTNEHDENSTKWLRSSADQENANAQFNLGAFYDNDKDIPKFHYAGLDEFITVKSGRQSEGNTKTIEEIKSEAGNDPIKRFDAGLDLLDLSNRQAYLEAIAIFEQLNREYPDSAPILNALGIAHYCNANPDMAKECFEKAWKIDPHERILKNIDYMR